MLVYLNDIARVGNILRIAGVIVPLGVYQQSVSALFMNSTP